jgi:tRNA threonylcarbamoyladenosine biosynthesis protein TsaE
MPKPRPATSATSGPAKQFGGSNQQSSVGLEIVSGSVEETQAFGERLGKLLRPGDVVALQGELGAGKTTLIQGVARGLGRDPASIKSPTFVLMREYGGETPLIHIDGYRLEGASQAAWLDLELIFSPDKITLIEWADRFAGLLPEDYIELRLAHKTTNRRSIQFVAHGVRSAQLIETLEQAVHSPQSTLHSKPEQAREK